MHQTDWILGASFIKSYYVSFRSSPAPAAIGFAPLSAVAVESLDQEGAIASRAADPTVSARIAFTSSSSSTRLTLSSTFFVLALLLALLAC